MNIINNVYILLNIISHIILTILISIIQPNISYDKECKYFNGIECRYLNGKCRHLHDIECRYLHDIECRYLHGN